jgi:hypothetical protein
MRDVLSRSATLEAAIEDYRFFQSAIVNRKSAIEGAAALELAIYNRRFIQSAIENRRSTIRELCGEAVRESGRERGEG